MSRVIIFCGLSGTGKTTLADVLSRELNVFCLHKDDLKERLYGLMEEETLGDSHRVGRYAIELILSEAEHAIRNDVDVILESPFNYPENPERFREWHKKFGAEVCIIVCVANDEERIRRRIDRPRHPAHHDSERPLLNAPGDDCDYEKMPDPKLILDTTQPLPRLLDLIRDFLKS